MDVVVICVFSVAAAFCGLTFAPEQGLDLWFVFTLLAQILGSILIGCGLGAGIGTYLKRRGPQLPLVIVGLCFLVYRFSDILGHHLEETYGITMHLEPLLICAAAGFVIQNLSHQGERLIHTMGKVSLPVYVIFFAMAGARLDLGALTASWSIAILIAGSRVAALVVGTRLATSLAGDSPLFRTNAWLGFVTQAGLSLALIAQIESSFDDWGARLATVLVAVVAINQLFGPAAFKFALERVGEARRRAGVRRRTI
jgi:Kef-type K+ transport system membrane component KefB